MDNSRIFREEQIWNRVFIPYKNAIRVILNATTERECVLIQVQPEDVGQELEIIIPKEVVKYSMKVRGSARMQISPTQGDIANGIFYSIGLHGVWKESDLASSTDLKIYVKIDKQRDIEIFFWKGNFQG